MPLVALEDGLGDLLWSREAARFTPNDEETEIRLAILDRSLRVVLDAQRFQVTLHPNKKTFGIVRVAHDGLWLAARSFLRHRSVPHDTARAGTTTLGIATTRD